MTTPMPWARFDDLVAGRAMVFPPPHRVLAAARPDEVVPVLAEVERATAAGDWAFGHLSYEAAPGLDPSLPAADPDPGDPPLVWFGLSGPPAETAPVTARGPYQTSARWVPDWTEDQHARAVSAVREHIAAGETYQCNLTDRLRAVVDDDPMALYERLALSQRGSYNAFLDEGRHVLASASPELFFDWTGDRLRTRPMKGTAPRGRTTAEDVDQTRRLLASPKERAENLMIVDLLRNDLAKVAVIGSVDVPELFTLERYPTVWQLTSEIVARSRSDCGLVDVFRALFPCGSVTGAPKQRSMEVIQALEGGPRGVYCGAIGMVAPPTAPFRARFNVAIRTVVVDRVRGTAVYGAGGGITWSSEAAAEHAELLTKAAVLDRPVVDHDLLETLAYLPGPGLRSLDRHLDRLADSARFFGFPCDRTGIRQLAAEAVHGRSAAARVRILLPRSGQASVTVSPLPDDAPGPVVLAVDDDPVDAGDLWSRHKTTHRAMYTSRAARHPWADDVVLVNDRGELTETTIANLAVHLDGRWWTPPVSSGCLPGVGRGVLLDQGRLRERVLRLHDLHRADALAVVSSLRGWRDAVLAGRPSGEDRSGAATPAMR
jgi:para-aminobenzoate synthetase / 4-amino-4-deoxychorismate lyase